MAYKKTVKGDNNQANEVGSFNHITIFNDGSGKIIVCFLIILLSTMLVYLWIEVHLLLVILIFGTLLLLSVLGVSAIFRHVSNTRKQHLVNEAEIQWSKIIHYTESHIAQLDVKTGTVYIHQARDITENRHFNERSVISEYAETLSNQDIPPTSDLLR